MRYYAPLQLYGWPQVASCCDDINTTIHRFEYQKWTTMAKKGAFQQPPYLFAFSVLPYLFAFSVLFAKYPYEGFIASHKMQINYAMKLTNT